MTQPEWPPRAATLALTSPPSPVPPAPAVQPGGHQARTVSNGLSGTLQGFLWAVGGLAAISTVLVLATLGAFRQYWDTPYGTLAEARAFDAWITAEDRYVSAATLMGLGMLVAFVLLVIWTYQAHKATQNLWTGGRRWSSGWTIGGWFIPVANLVIPRSVIVEIEKLATSPRSAGRADERWRRQPTAAIGWVWWIAFVAGWILTAVANGVGTGPEASSDAITAGYALSALGLATLAAGAACGAVYIRRISRALGPEGVGADRGLAPPYLPVHPSQDTVRFSTARWSSTELASITQALDHRGVSYRMSEGNLIVGRDAIEVTDTIVAEFTMPDDRWT